MWRRRRFKTSSTQWVLLYTRVVTDYLLERYERGISGNYNHGDPSGEFSAIPMPATAAACGRRGIAAVLCSSTEYYRNPLVFHRTLRFFSPPRPAPTSFAPMNLRAGARSYWLFPYIRTPKPYTFSTPTTHPPSAAFLLLPIQFYAGTRLPWAVSVICFYRHVRTNERFNFTRVKKKMKKAGKNEMIFFQLYIYYYARVIVRSLINVQDLYIILYTYTIIRIHVTWRCTCYSLCSSYRGYLYCCEFENSALEVLYNIPTTQFIPL